MVILCTIDLETREVSLPAGQVIASYDHNVDVIRFQAEAIPGFSLDTSTIRIAAQGPNKARHDYAVDPSTVAIEEETGYITFDWPIPAGVTEMPIGPGFKYGDKGNLIFAVCAEIIDGSTVSKAWHSDDGIITVVAHLEPEAGGGEDPSETATNAQMIAQLQTDVAVVQREVSAVAGGTPTVVDAKADMTEHDKIYILSSDGKWYYYSATAEDWLVGGTYGGAVTDTTLSISGAAADAKAVGDAIDNITIEVDDTLSEQGKAADAKAVGDALALKADDTDVTALDTRVTAVEGDVNALDDDIGDLKNTIQPLGLVPYVCKYPSDASGYRNIPFTLPAGNYKVTVTGTSVNVRFVDANITDVINAVPYTAVNYPITLTDEQATALTYLRLAGGEVSVYPAETIVTNAESLRSDVDVISSELHELTSDRTWIVPSNFEQGTLYVTGGKVKENPNTKRVRQKISKARHLTPNSTVSLTDYSHYKFMVFSSADNGETWTQGSWITSGDFITSGASTIYLLLIEDTTAETVDVETLVSLIHYDEAGTFISKVETKLKNISGNPFFAHLSFDDVQYCMIDLKNNANNYDSIFDNPFFAMLKNLHDVYGTVVSLYLFLTNSEGGISAYPTTFASEFAENADWLKFGLHQGSTNYASTSAATALSDYEMFTSNIVNIGGTVDIIDRCPRLGNFAGNLVSMQTMRDADGGIVGLLSAYDTRDSYYLSSADSAYLFSHGKLVDSTNHLTFFRTIKTFEVANPSTELPKLQTLAGMNGAPYGIIMMHEYAVYGSDYALVDSMKSRLEYACAWMVANGYAWDYPMYRIYK